ncbi:MAG: UDP-N-acetylmuramate:L-alanyl-gamma-D-glutamyl-meso-diaminopimelate ligase [Gammaproteobacteria bacterium]|nr:UDP-N-acetylmuramate:L-alanyl-gamma-D-glutamyl-meso-diaminopimelate ligase [Gammaproteobacteria bacterium]MCW8840331.1 UDP-N-acetylmuramate:L-alanyl-gamma-D-glutamyl-meso-diaminopimelate ligase [Gammaproteobacteria bacterium]MCW8927967.1 UDP-N-acetylmuramate:L-alanyl-gamma-D-glutamyl-meso-diaminopimelate ligase [Gammaproteobacteria bacterium]MCW8957747.1 UDP-N-acetylmuramate:L-alanyl-gamma-D-glutamyl-meso-diaminopimelate ligase [Gammaproteobacteria bacterium]MCW8972976.1 UDP-N-acetylmuramate
MKIHILGICGTFMGGVALLARSLGHEVSGQDAGVYPPMSTQLAEQGITLYEGYDPGAIPAEVEMVVIGNALSRGNPAVEHVLNRGLPYTSGAQWLSDNLLGGCWVLAVAGTHGKTTTASMLAWILEFAGMRPGFLIGGIPQNFGLSARRGETPFFVVEADEYDTAFFDKRSKFVHYRPRTLVLNNLEFDHADIFPDLAAIQRQFHHLVRTVPGEGLILAPAGDENMTEVLRMGCWTPVEPFAAEKGWGRRLLADDGSRFEVLWCGTSQGVVEWELLGEHNVSNALAAIGAARHAGVPAAQAIEALAAFRNVKRRMEVRGEAGGVTVYDDFAHHPTAIAATLDGLRKKVGAARIIAVLEPRSNTMRMGVHRETLLPSLAAADRIFIYAPADLGWELPAGGADTVSSCSDFDELLQRVLQEARPGDHLLVMSNGGFGGIHGKLLQMLAD